MAALNADSSSLSRPLSARRSDERSAMERVTTAFGLGKKK
jgi:hypothetical protein